MHPARITQVSRGADQELIDDSEHRDVGAEPQSERQSHGCSERRTSTESARGVAEILEQDFEPRHPPYIASVVLDALDAAERDPGLPTRFVGRESGSFELLRLLFYVKAELVVEVILDRS